MDDFGKHAETQKLGGCHAVQRIELASVLVLVVVLRRVMAG
jgi:hypothetical protein